MHILEMPGAPQEPYEVVRLKRAAEIMDISERTLHNLIRDGKIATIGSGHLRRIALVDIRRWQEENRGYGKAETTR